MEQQLELDVKLCTVRQATLQAYRQMPRRFSSLTLCLTVRSIQNKRTMDGTILRRLRELRNEGVAFYKVINSGQGVYEKPEA